MARCRTCTVEFKRQVVEERLVGGTSLNQLARRHDISRELLRTWVKKYEAGDLAGQSDEGLRSYHELAAASPRLSCSDSSEAFRVAGRQLSGMATLDPTTGQCGDRRSNG